MAQCIAEGAIAQIPKTHSCWGRVRRKSSDSEPCFGYSLARAHPGFPWRCDWANPVGQP
jgi:hypothetical protein